MPPCMASWCGRSGLHLGGHFLYLAVHVLPVGRWTRPYMMLIDPFRRWLVYPAMLRGIHQAWLAHAANAKPAVAE